MFNPTRISETKQAMNLVLEKIHNLALLGKDKDLDIEDDEAPELHYIFNILDLNGEDYLVPKETFEEIMTSLEKKKIIELDGMTEEDAASAFKDYVLACEFVADVIRVNPSANVREILKHQIAFFRVVNLSALEKEITKFKSFKSKQINKKFPEKVLISVSLDENKKCLVIITSSGGEEISFKKKQIKREDSRFAINPRRLEESENEKAETKFFKAFATFFDMSETVADFENLKFSNTTSISELAQVLKISEKSARNYIKRIKDIFKEKGLPMKLESDNKGNYKLFIKISKRVNKNK